ncbi:ABC transporter ATP-binding protein [Candidatus Acetothermia bacterium]|nr:ABC transporter ATP-binding protein [Candidatus Acetothermia bacterium]
MTIIRAEGVGVKFRLHREKHLSFRKSVADLITRKSQRSEDFWALRNINLSVNEGETLGVIGRNGSGKSTLLRLFGKIFAPDEGKLEINGTASTLLSLAAGFQQELSGLENIYLNGVIMGFREREIDAELSHIISFSELDDFIEVPVKTYSSGMYARLGFSIAIHLKRDIMLIDEVLGVGDAKFHDKCSQKIKELMSEGRTIILISHGMESIQELADKAIWLDKGRLLAEGKPAEVIRQYLSS